MVCRFTIDPSRLVWTVARVGLSSQFFLYPLYTYCYTECQSASIIDPVQQKIITSRRMFMDGSSASIVPTSTSHTRQGIHHNSIRIVKDQPKGNTYETFLDMHTDNCNVPQTSLSFVVKVGKAAQFYLSKPCMKFNLVVECVLRIATEYLCAMLFLTQILHNLSIQLLSNCTCLQHQCLAVSQYL